MRSSSAQRASTTQGARGLLLMGTVVGLGRLLVWLTADPTGDVWAWLAGGQSPSGGWTLDRIVVDVAACALLAVGTVLGCLVIVIVAEAVLATRIPALSSFSACISPTWVRRGVVALCGMALTAPALSAAASAHESGTGGPSPESTLEVSGLPLPDLPSSPRSRTVKPALSLPQVVVHSGDTLWSIAASELPAEASNAAIATRVAALYAANRDRIGDPDLIFPGQRLTAPGGAS